MLNNGDIKKIEILISSAILGLNGKNADTAALDSIQGHLIDARRQLVKYLADGKYNLDISRSLKLEVSCNDQISADIKRACDTAHNEEQKIKKLIEMTDNVLRRIILKRGKSDQAQVNADYASGSYGGNSAAWRVLNLMDGCKINDGFNNLPVPALGSRGSGGSTGIAEKINSSLAYGSAVQHDSNIKKVSKLIQKFLEQKI
jgi:hypothetical protein